MDNLTHSLVGALIGQMGLKRKTGLAMPTLIIAANLPDIDAFAVLLGGQQHLAFRRGITHGPIAMLVLPLLLWGVMLWFDRWQARRGKRPEKRLPVDPKWLLALAYMGCLSHPLFDWFNSYGIRLLAPFSDQWFAGDTIFIIDVWMLATLILALMFSFRRERTGQGDWQRLAFFAFAAIGAYIFANGAITGRAEAYFHDHVEENTGQKAFLVVANPVPFEFWRREMLWRNDRVYGGGSYGLFEEPYIRGRVLPHYMDNNAVLALLYGSPEARDFLIWSRMPVVRIGPAPARSLTLTDQRFANPLVADRFSVRVESR